MDTDYATKVDITDKLITINIEEYKIRTNEILKRVELQSGILRMQIALVSSVIAAIIALLTKSADYQNLLTYLLILAPFPFYFLSWSHANHDYMICANARYLASKTFGDIKSYLYKHDILTWEAFLYKERLWRGTYLPRGLTHGEEYFISLYVPVICTVIAYLFMVSKLMVVCNDDNSIKLVYDTITSMCNLQLGITESIVAIQLISFACQLFFILLNVHFIFYTIQTRDTVRKSYERIITLD